MKSNLELRTEDLRFNTHPRLAICFCLDTSASMAGEPIQELQDGVASFLDFVRSHDEARYAAEVAVVTFGQGVQPVLDFASIDRQSVPELVPSGATPMGAGVNLALDLLERAQREYKQNGLERYKPWLVVISDGIPTDPLDHAAARVAQLVNQRQLSVFAVGVGPQVQYEPLKQLSPNRMPLRLKGLDFAGFFDWVGKSIARVSVSQPTDEVPLDMKPIGDFAQGWDKA